MFLLRRLRRSVTEEVRSKLGPDRIVIMDERANSFGVESGGVRQIRGNGCLAATPEELLFVMWVPRREVRIPRQRITGIERAASHLGKTVARPLLRVRFTNDEGRPDSVAWLVADLPGWEAALRG